MVEILRTIFKKEIVTEFLVPSNKTNKVIIFCAGMPGYPNHKDTLEFYSKKGYWVFLPRYRGSWESKGQFFKKSPHLDVLDIINQLSECFVDLWGNKKYSIKNPEVYLIGWSFGGPAVILASKNDRVKKVVAISPLIDWTVDSKTEPNEKFGKFIESAFGEGYRFASKDWDNLIKGKFYNPITELEKVDGNKIWIIHSKDDDIVPYRPSEKFSKLTNSKLTLFSKGGHGIGRKIIRNSNFYKKLNKFFKEK